ncbi:MAG: hypothetical protein U9Q77_04300 [Candidatus Marinimicrobia bacterium]|nr:hypothetical protein [Candidatus Neomarinimicrobiota bacterium]
MKTKTALTLAVILGLITYSLPLYAATNKAYHVEERTVIEIPVVGKITTLTSSYLSGCKLKETTLIKMHNTLVKMISDSDGKSQEILLSDLCDKIRWRYDENKQVYSSVSFEEVRQERVRQEAENELQIDMESDQNDIDDSPRLTHEIMGYEKNINGFKARKVVTRVYVKSIDNPIIIEEYYAADTKPLKKITVAREKVAQEMGAGDNHIDGVPGFIMAAYDGMRQDKELARPEGEVVRFVISLLDNDDDPIFSMKYDVLKAEKIAYQPDHFALK